MLERSAALARHAEELAQVSLAGLEQGLQVVQLELVGIELRRDLLTLLLGDVSRAASLLQDLLLSLAAGEELLVARGARPFLDGAGVPGLVEQVVQGLGGGTGGQRRGHPEQEGREEPVRVHERLSIGAGTGAVSRSGALALSATAKPCLTALR